MQKKVGLLDQLSPDYGYDENGLWDGMTKEQVITAMAKRARELTLRNALRHWTPSSLPN